MFCDTPRSCSADTGRCCRSPGCPRERTVLVPLELITQGFVHAGSSAALGHLCCRGCSWAVCLFGFIRQGCERAICIQDHPSDEPRQSDGVSHSHIVHSAQCPCPQEGPDPVE